MKEKINNLLKRVKPYSYGFYIGIIMYLIVNYPKLKRQFLNDPLSSKETVIKYAKHVSKKMDQKTLKLIQEAKDYVANNLPKNLNLSKEEVIDTLNKVYIIPMSKGLKKTTYKNVAGVLSIAPDYEIIFFNLEYLSYDNVQFKNTLVHELYHFIDERRDTLKNNEYDNIAKKLIDLNISEERFKKLSEFILKDYLIRKKISNKEKINMFNTLYLEFVEEKENNYLFSKSEEYARLNAIKHTILDLTGEKEINTNNFIKGVKKIGLRTNSDFYYLVLLLNNIDNIELLNEI